ncbi:MAG: negative modulator of initiation of replication [Paraglaciecola sp.]|jgi:negative modulator of initiation of replication
MKNIEIEDDLYAYIASQTQHIGETASDILRRIVMPGNGQPALISSSTDRGLEKKGDIFKQINEEQLLEYPKMVERFLLILSKLHQIHGQGFERVLQISGRNRVYFAKDKEQLLQASSVTNPKSIPDSEFWVMTNNNTGKKASLLREVAEALEYSPEQGKRLALLFAPELFTD